MLFIFSNVPSLFMCVCAFCFCFFFFGFGPHPISIDVLEDKADVADRWGKLKSSALPFFERKVITLMGKDVQLRYRGEVSQTLHELIVDGFLGAGSYFVAQL